MLAEQDKKDDIYRYDMMMPFKGKWDITTSILLTRYYEKSLSFGRCENYPLTSTCDTTIIYSI